MRTAKTLIRLGGCPGWSESSLGAHLFCWFCHVAAQMICPKASSTFLLYDKAYSNFRISYTKFFGCQIFFRFLHSWHYCRVLAADSQQILGGATVKAYFVLEDSIKDDWFYEQDGCQQLSVGKIKGQQIKNNSEKFILVKKDHRYEGKFCNIILQGFDRGQRSKLVHEEKYRILFHTCVDNHEIWVSFDICIHLLSFLFPSSPHSRVVKAANL